MATAVFRNGRADRGLEIPATGCSSAIHTDLGGKKYEFGSVVGLLFPKLRFPEAATVMLWRSSSSVQEMLTHQGGMWVNFCPADPKLGMRMWESWLGLSWRCLIASWSEEKWNQAVR